MDQYNSAKNALDLGQRDSLESWEIEAWNEGELGKAVVRNVRAESHFEDEGVFGSALASLASETERDASCSEAFEATCYKSHFDSGSRHCLFQQSGRVAEVHASTTLYRLIRNDDFKWILSDAVGASVVSDDVLDQYSVQMDSDEKLEILSSAHLHVRRFQVFATFDPILGSRGSDRSPLELLSAKEARGRLGLRPEWPGYSDTDSLWEAAYRPPHSVARRIPTVIDAGWRDQFRPHSRDDSPWGLTVPLEGGDGLPEIVHDDGMGWYIKPLRLLSADATLGDEVGGHEE